jgi:hypothetical protein
LAVVVLVADRQVVDVDAEVDLVLTRAGRRVDLSATHEDAGVALGLDEAELLQPWEK